MRRRTGAAGALFAIIATVPSAGPAHAQDLDCTHFSHQEDAQAVFDADRSDPHRLDEDRGPDDGVACEVLPVRGGDGDGDGDLTSSTSRPRRTTAPVTPVNPVTPVTPAVPGPATPTAPATAPAPVTPTAPATATVTGAPTRGVRGGVGGATETGPGTWDLALGATFVAGAALTTGYVVRRRRR